MSSDLLDVFLKKPFSSKSLILGHMNEFVCHQSGAICAVESSNDVVCSCQAPGIGGEQTNSLR